MVLVRQFYWLIALSSYKNLPGIFGALRPLVRYSHEPLVAWFQIFSQLQLLPFLVYRVQIVQFPAILCLEKFQLSPENGVENFKQKFFSKILKLFILWLMRSDSWTIKMTPNSNLWPISRYDVICLGSSPNHYVKVWVTHSPWVTTHKS